MPVAPLPGSLAEDLVVVLPDGSTLPFDDDDVRIPEVGDAEVVRVVSVMDGERAFGWLAPWPAWFELDGAAFSSQQSGEGSIGPLSTAVQLVLGTPPLFTLDPVVQRDVVTVLAGLDEVVALADFLEAEAATGDPLEHASYPSLLATAVTVAVETLGAYGFDEAASSASSGLDAAGGRFDLAAALRTSQTTDVPVSSLSLDQVFTRIRPMDGQLEVAWDASVPRRERGLTYYGQFYRLDASQFESESAMRSHFLNAPWTTDVTLDLSVEPVPIALPADTRWVYFDLVSTALNAIEGLVLDESGVPLDQEGLYAAHLYSCSAGINLAEIVRENRRNDLDLLRGWPSDQASMVAPCIMFVTESALNVLSVYVDLDEVLREEQVVSLVQEVTATVVAAGDRVIQTRDMLPIINEAAKTAASMAVATLLDIGAEQGVRGVGRVALKNLAAVLNIGNIISNGGQLGARLTASAGMTPWEGRIVTVGDPWDVEPGGGSEGLIAHWTFDDCTGADATGNGNAVNLIGGGTLACAEGVSGDALALDGTQGLSTAEAPVGLPTGSSDRTVAAWAYMTAGNDSIQDRSVAGYGSASTGRRFVLQYGLGQTYVWGVWQHSCSYDVIVGSPADDCYSQHGAPGTVEEGRWYHLAATHDGSTDTTTLYVDGQPVGSRSVAIATTSTAFTIGTSPDATSGASEFAGRVDDVRLYDRALTDAEVLDLAQAAP